MALLFITPKMHESLCLLSQNNRASLQGCISENPRRINLKLGTQMVDTLGFTHHDYQLFIINASLFIRSNMRITWK